jgi:hypothetical protein
MATQHPALVEYTGHTNHIYCKHSIYAPYGDKYDNKMITTSSTRREFSRHIFYLPWLFTTESSNNHEILEKTSSHYSMSYLKLQQKGCSQPANVHTRGMYISRSSSFPTLGSSLMPLRHNSFLSLSDFSLPHMSKPICSHHSTDFF